LKAGELTCPNKIVDILSGFYKHWSRWQGMQRIRTIFQLLLSDERSAVRCRTAILTSFVILATVILGLVLMSLGDQIYRDLDRRILIAACDPAGGPLV
jgi:hypothetical protein